VRGASSFVRELATARQAPAKASGRAVLVEAAPTTLEQALDLPALLGRERFNERTRQRHHALARTLEQRTQLVAQDRLGAFAVTGVAQRTCALDDLARRGASFVRDWRELARHIPSRGALVLGDAEVLAHALAALAGALVAATVLVAAGPVAVAARALLGALAARGLPTTFLDGREGRAAGENQGCECENDVLLHGEFLRGDAL
jgi:hypothetical protein